MESPGMFIFNISKSILELGEKLYTVLNTSVNISFVLKIVDFFGGSVNLPNEISLIWLLTGGSVIVLAILIIVKVVL